VSDNRAAVAKAITERMADLGINQVELVKRSGLGKSTVNEVLRDKKARSRRPHTLERLSEALGWHRHHLAHVLRGKQPPEVSQPVEGTAPRFDAIEDRLDEIVDRLGVIETRLGRLDTIDTKLTKFLRRVDGAWPSHQ
jgi:transcriptional regulator with XRE-family HTH domain